MASPAKLAMVAPLTRLPLNASGRPSRGFQLRHGGQLDRRGDRIMAELAILVCHANQPVRRDRRRGATAGDEAEITRAGAGGNARLITLPKSSSAARAPSPFSASRSSPGCSCCCASGGQTDRCCSPARKSSANWRVWSRICGNCVRSCCKRGCMAAPKASGIDGINIEQLPAGQNR